MQLETMMLLCQSQGGCNRVDVNPFTELWLADCSKPLKSISVCSRKQMLSHKSRCPRHLFCTLCICKLVTSTTGSMARLQSRDDSITCYFGRRTTETGSNPNLYYSKNRRKFYIIPKIIVNQKKKGSQTLSLTEIWNDEGTCQRLVDFETQASTVFESFHSFISISSNALDFLSIL